MRMLRPGLPLLLVVAALLFAPALYSRGPWQVDELRYAEVARQMGEYGHLLVPHANGEVYPEKPPLYFLLVDLARPLTGDGIAAGRLVAALSILASAWLLVPLSRRLLGRSGPGWLGALVFLTTLMGIDRGEQGFIDSLLVSLTTGATVALLLSAGAETTRRRWGLAAAGAACMAAAVLTKGPVGVLCPVIGVVAAGAVAHGRRGVPVLPLLAAVAAAAAVGLLWLVLAARDVGWWYFDRMLFAQSAERAVDSYAHAAPPWYYLGSLARYLLPWTILVPGAAWLLWRRRREGCARGAVAAAVFALAGVAVFSAISGKRPAYILPFYPPLALVIGWAILELAAGARWFRSAAAERVPFYALAALPVVAGAAVGAGSIAVGAGAIRIAVAFGAGAAAAAAGILALRAMRADDFPRVAAGAAAGLALAVAGAHLAIVPVLDPEKSPDAFGAALVEHFDPSEPYLLFGSTLDGRVTFYTDREHFDVVDRDPAAVLAAADAPGRARIVAEARDWKDLPEAVRTRFAPIPGTVIPIGRRDWGVWRER